MNINLVDSVYQKNPLGSHTGMSAREVCVLYTAAFQAALATADTHLMIAQVTGADESERYWREQRVEVCEILAWWASGSFPSSIDQMQEAADLADEDLDYDGTPVVAKTTIDHVSVHWALGAVYVLSTCRDFNLHTPINVSAHVALNDSDIVVKAKVVRLLQGMGYTFSNVVTWDIEQG